MRFFKKLLKSWRYFEKKKLRKFWMIIGNLSEILESIQIVFDGIYVLNR